MLGTFSCSDTLQNERMKNYVKWLGDTNLQILKKMYEWNNIFSHIRWDFAIVAVCGFSPGVLCQKSQFPFLEPISCPSNSIIRSYLAGCLHCDSFALYYPTLKTEGNPNRAGITISILHFNISNHVA